MDTRLRAKGVQDDPKKKAIRQAVQGLSGKGGPVGGMTVKDLSEELGIKDSTLRRWACEHEEMGDDAFPVHSVKQESTFGDADEKPIQTKAVWRPACTQGKIS